MQTENFKKRIRVNFMLVVNISIGGKTLDSNDRLEKELRRRNNSAST
jgi:hypothetical protein